MKIFDNANSRRGGKGCLVAIAPHVGGLFRFDVDLKVPRTGHRSRDVSRERKWYTLPNTIRSEYIYMDILELEELKRPETLVPIASSPPIKQPAAQGNSKWGNAVGGSSACHLKDCEGSSDDNDDDNEDEENPPGAIDISNKTSFLGEFAGLDGNLRSA
jgi:hypothetical protein